MNATRKQAEQNYQTALTAFDVATSGTDMDAFLAANESLTAARSALIKAEENYPTAAEAKRTNRKQWLRKIGLDA